MILLRMSSPSKLFEQILRLLILVLLFFCFCFPIAFPTNQIKCGDLFIVLSESTLTYTRLLVIKLDVLYIYTEQYVFKANIS